MRHLEIIKCVAGAGKTTYSIDYLKKHKNGLYIAYTNSVVNDVKYHGYLSKTIDSLFISFIIPKFIKLIPIIHDDSTIKYIDSKGLKGYQKNILNLSIKKNGDIYNQHKKSIFSIKTTNEELKKSNGKLNQKTLLQIFRNDSVILTQNILDDLCSYLIVNYKKELQELLKYRFSYIIIDEAQDLKGFREEFAQLLYESSIDLIVLGDDNQNIINHGKWFENLQSTRVNEKSHRTCDNICKWIRDNLNITIYGNDKNYNYYEINNSDVEKYDNGKRVLIYNKKDKYNEDLINSWKGKKITIKSAKGNTIEEEIVIIGNSLNKKNMYTALTRTTKNVYSTIRKISDK